MLLDIVPLAATSDNWIVSWLTPLWVFGLSITIGLSILAVLLGLFWVLSKVNVFASLQKSAAGHFVALGLSIVLAIVATASVASYFAIGNESIPFDELSLLAVLFWFVAAVFSWALIYCPSPRFFDDLAPMLFSGYGAVLLFSLIAIAIGGLCCGFVADDKFELLTSVPELLVPSQVSYSLEIPGLPQDQEIPELIEQTGIQFDPEQLESIRIESNRNIIITDADSFADLQIAPTEVFANEPVFWQSSSVDSAPMPIYPGSRIFIQNNEIDDASVSITIESRPAVPESRGMVLGALAVVTIGLIFFLQQSVAPKTAAISLAAAKSEIVQPIFLCLVLLGLFFILLFSFMPFYTLGEDIKLLKDCGITVILIIALLQGVWSASSSVSDEIEGRTALTVLSKPINRRSFMIGKMLGVFWVLMLIFVILGTAELIGTAYKPIYDARESSEGLPSWQACFKEAASVVPGLFMALLHAVILGTFSVAISTRVTQFANFAVCLSVYLVGQLVETIVTVTNDGFAIPQFIGQLIAVIVPNLQTFSMQSAIDVSRDIPMSYLSGAFVYAMLYTGVAVLIGLLLFEDRDLA